MKSYTLIPQERGDYCVCSVLQAILRAHGNFFSQNNIASKLSHKEGGFDLEDDKIKLFFRSNGLLYIPYRHNQTPFNERDSLLDEMYENEGIVAVDTHCYLLVSFAYPLISMIDPKDAALVTKSLPELIREMEKSRGVFGLIKSS